ncbi:MAG TPA: hypothetical protein VF690_20120 [Hymenobacter sp.]|jgi:hypothetical protein
MYSVVNPLRLKKLLQLDALMGGTTAIGGLAFPSAVAKLLGLSTGFVVSVAGITLLYAGVALWLAVQPVPNLRLTRVLIQANWVWTLISVGLLLVHFRAATALGVVFLVLQVVVVGGLAYLEGQQVRANP